MTDYQAQELNRFFVETFNQILAWEERALNATGLTNLSVKELHILDTTFRLQQQEQNTMSQIAAALDISVGALTTAVNTLVKKGYLTRAGRAQDRRIVLVELTKSGHQANEMHTGFHQEMIAQVGAVLQEPELEMLTSSLQRLTDFFENLK
ncbi:MAG: MarR family transcriptional regulator [Oscillospiraceae bacterium]|jgi:DNA-binding MarR family transcriptional regulator|nr:MarR family transcriptional regulator [Oscillospiraceae bacterium]